MFVHIVNFWLKKDLRPDDIAKFEQGIHSLKEISTIRIFHVGVPASTDRPVIDRSYSYCLLTVFEDKEGHDLYQSDSIHLQFLESCRHMWEKVIIYDSIPKI